MYPRQLLTSQFWTIQQRNEFEIVNLRARLEYNRKVFRYLQAKLSEIKNDELYDKWQHILGLLGSGMHPSTTEILEVKDLFSRRPYNTKSLSGNHIVSKIPSV